MAQPPASAPAERERNTRAQRGCSLAPGAARIPLALAGAMTEIDVVEQDAGMLAEADKALAGL
ncbi:hypothetical protein ABZ020_42570, partial [Streptomyces sp. NPDC006355]